MKIDRATAAALGKEIETVLRAHFADRPDLSVAYRGGTFDAFTFKAKLEITAKDGDMTAEKAAFGKMADLFGLKPEDYGREFQAAGRAFRIVGLAPQRPKFAVEAIEVSTGKRFKFTAHVLRDKFGAEVPDFLLWTGRR